MDCGACLGCGLGINEPLQIENKQIVTWQSGKPNPLPMFKNPYEFYTPILLPGPYLPIELVTPFSKKDGLHYYPLSDSDLVDVLIAFILHESIHQTLFLGIIPTTQRLAATNFYTTLAILLSRNFDPYLWETLNRLNYVIDVVHKATAAMHEVAAIVENQITTPFNNPYIQNLSEKSANHYAKDENYGSDFIQHYNTFRSLITVLKEWFSPTPLQRLTIIILADYIISSAIDLQELASSVLDIPKPITDTSLRDYIRDAGVPYLELGKRTLKNCPVIQIGLLGGVTVYGTGWRLERTMETILSAKLKRKRKMPDNYREQILYIADLIPELKLWLQSIDARHWVKRRILNVITDHQVHLEQYGVALPLTEVWQSDLSAFISIKKPGLDGKNLRITSVGRQPEDFTARAAKITHNYWLAYDIQKDEPLGIMSGPRCIDRTPLSPLVNMICTPNSIELGRRLMTLVIFESLRMQLAEGCGLVCPWYGLIYEGKGHSCCGEASTLWQIYNLGLKAAETANWQPKQWIAPECKQLKTKRIPKVKTPHCRVPHDSDIFL